MAKIINVVPTINNISAGPSYSVPRLCAAVSDVGNDVHLHCLGSVPNRSPDFSIHNYEAWQFPRKLGVSPQMHRALKQEAKTADIMHNHSLWMMPNIYPAWAVRNTHCRLVTSPRGTLAPNAWVRSRFVKSCIWPWQKEVLTSAACLHATAYSEYEQIRTRGFRAPVAIIPNGIDLPELIVQATGDESRKLLFLGRIHPIKGVDLLLQVWSRLEMTFPEWELHIVGPDNGGHRQKMEDLSNSLSHRRVVFKDAVYGDEKNATYQDADLFVLPSQTENFGMAVAEALSNETPAIVTKGAPWKGLEENNCGWWVNRDEDVLFRALSESMSLSRVELKSMGKNGRTWMENEFSWDGIGKKMHLTYEWLLGGGHEPEWVEVC